MNYLAHLFLSGNDDETMVGNFIGDHVKGNDWVHFPQKIANGILMHRQIDFFTDTHQMHREAKVFFRPEFGHYSGIVVDFLYDHFLATNWNAYSEITLRTFAKQSHAVLLKNFVHLPFRVQGFLPFLIQHRRLESYATTDGIIQALQIMSKYSSLPAKNDFVKRTLQDNYEPLEANFKIFMAEIIRFITDKFGLEFYTSGF